MPRGVTEQDKPVFPYDDPIRFAYLPQRAQTKIWSQLSPAGVGSTQNALGGNTQCQKTPRSALLVCLWVILLAWHSTAKSRCPLWDASALSGLVQLSGLLPGFIHLWLISFLGAGEGWHRQLHTNPMSLTAESLGVSMQLLSGDMALGGDVHSEHCPAAWTCIYSSLPSLHSLHNSLSCTLRSCQEKKHLFGRGSTKQPLCSAVMDKTLTEVKFGTQHLNRFKAGWVTAAADTEQWTANFVWGFSH